MTSVPTRFLLAGLAITAMLASIPATAAQGEATVSDNGSDTAVPNLLPEIEESEVELKYTYTFPSIAAPAIGVARTTAVATVTIDCIDPQNILITGPKTKSFSINPQASQAATDVDFEFVLAVGVTRQLEGLKRLACETSVVVGQVDPGTGQVVGETPAAVGSFTVGAKYYGLVQSKVAKQIAKTGPQKDISFPITLDNFGNARTRIQFEVAERPGGAKWSQVVPDDVILDSPYGTAEKTQDTANFQVTTTYKNGWNNEQGVYRLKLKIFAADDPTQTSPDLSANMLIRVRGVYVPTLEPFLLVGAVLASAMLIRARQEDE